MKIKLQIKEIDDFSNSSIKFKKVIKSKLDSLLDFFNSPNEIIDYFIITDKENYIQAIKLINKNEDYTNNENFVGFGKTIKVNNKSSIIIRIEVILIIVNSINNDRLTTDEEFCQYILSHEIGHAIDNKLRNQNKIEIETFFDEKNISTYYIEVLKGEFSACWNSGGIVSKCLYNDLIKNTSITIQTVFDEIIEIKNGLEFTDRQKKYGVADRIWMILIEIAKVHAISIKNDFSKFKIKGNWDTTLEDELYEFIKLTSQNYPKLNTEIDNKIFKIWKKMYNKEYPIL